MAKWWDSNYQYRKHLRVSNKEFFSLTSSYAVETVIDTKAIVDDSKMLSSGDDLRVVYWNSPNNTELDRHILNMNTTSSTVVFKTVDRIGGSWTDDRYYMYYGYSSAANPPADNTKIYESWDDFDTTTGSWYKVGAGGSFRIANSYLEYTGSAALTMIRKDTGIAGTGKRKQMWVKIHPVKPTWWANRVMNWGIEIEPNGDYYCMNECCTGVYPNKNYIGAGGDARQAGVCRTKINNGSGSGTLGTNYTAVADFRIYKFKWGTLWNEVQEENIVQQTANYNVGMSLTDKMYMTFYSYGHTGSMLIDWVSWSPYTNNEPVVTAGNEEVVGYTHYNVSKVTGVTKARI